VSERWQVGVERADGDIIRRRFSFWSERMRKETNSIADLKPDERNPRKHNPRNIGMIERALNEVGAARSIVIDEENRVLAGNGVIEAAANAGIEKVRVVEADGNEIIAVRRAGLTEEQKRKLAYYDNRTAELAEWDAEQIAFDVDSGFDFEGLFTGEELAVLSGQDDKYSKKVITPIYEPSGATPTVHELYDDSKVCELLQEIEEAPGLSDEEREFLQVAAWRHAVLHFDKIADFYANARPEVQRLMENSALIIIDFHHAIELGFVHLRDKIYQQLADEYDE